MKRFIKMVIKFTYEEDFLLNRAKREKGKLINKR